MFKEHLEKVVKNVEGGIAAMLMGFDGIAIESYIREDADRDLDIQTVGMELSLIMTHIWKAAETLEEGKVEEVTIKTDKLILIFRILTSEYFVLLGLTPSGNFGKARFLLRIQIPKLLADLE